jgi:protein-S-isoprenylcysteine O-methyltransferase Ste14
LLVFLGLGISFGNWLSLIIVVVPTSLAFMQRIAIEEAALARALGDSYLRYMARTKRLIPGVYQSLQLPEDRYRLVREWQAHEF